MTNVQKPSDKKILVVYFSHSGNTRAIAEMIHRNTDSDIFEIVTVDPYPGNYNQCVDQAKKEQNANFRPKLSTHVANMANYDTIFLGNPNWWGTLPMAVFTFLEENDLSGKTIVPFCTHEGSGLGQCPNDIAKLCPKAKLLEGLAIRGTNAKSSEKDVVRWLKGLDL